MDFCVIIPARLASKRLPQKLLKPIKNKPLIQFTYENALASAALKIIIATSDEEIKKVATNFGAEVCLTSKNHSSGTSRICEVVEKLNIKDDDIIVNLQADEPMLPASLINQVAANLQKNRVQMATLCEPILDEDMYLDPNCVKVVFDNSGRALWFSRAPMPFFRDQSFDAKICFKHIGIYAYRAGFIKKYHQLSDSKYEQAEKLEQLKILQHGFDIHIEKALENSGFGVDTEQDLAKVKSIIEEQK